MIEPELPAKSTELDKCFAQLTPTIENSINTASKNTFATFRVKRVKNPDPTSAQYILKTTKDTTITQNVKKRLNKLRFLPEHENIVPVYVLSEYFQGSQPLAKVIENNKMSEIQGGHLKSIFYQVIIAMKFLEENRMNHLRLNPSSILLKFPTLLQSKQNPVVRICDFGISAQNTANYFYKFCLHPHYFDPNRNIDTQSYEDCVKYDLWALGAIIYYSLKQVKPFHGKESFFGDNMIFKTKHAQAPDSWLAKDKSYTITQSSLLERFIARCWGLKSKPVFKSWAEALQFYEENGFQATKMEKASIFQIYNNHVSLVFLLSKVYILLREELQYQITKIAQGPTSVSKKENINSLSLFVFKFAHLCHTSSFQTHFINRCSVLPRHKRVLLDQLKSYLECESLSLKQFFRDQRQYSFDQFVENVGQIAKFKAQLKQINESYITPKVEFLLGFFDELLKEVPEAQKVRVDPKRDRGELLNVFYKSQPLQKRAISCGLSIPKFSLIPQE